MHGWKKIFIPASIWIEHGSLWKTTTYSFRRFLRRPDGGLECNVLCDPLLDLVSTTLPIIPPTAQSYSTKFSLETSYCVDLHTFHSLLDSGSITFSIRSHHRAEYDNLKYLINSASPLARLDTSELEELQKHAAPLTLHIRRGLTSNRLSDLHLLHKFHIVSSLSNSPPLRILLCPFPFPSITDWKDLSLSSNRKYEFSSTQASRRVFCRSTPHFCDRQTSSHMSAFITSLNWPCLQSKLLLLCSRFFLAPLRPLMRWHTAGRAQNKQTTAFAGAWHGAKGVSRVLRRRGKVGRLRRGAQAEWERKQEGLSASEAGNEVGTISCSYSL